MIINKDCIFIVGGHLHYNFPHGYNQYTMHNPVGNTRSLQTPYLGNDQGKILLLKRSWPFHVIIIWIAYTFLLI